MPNRVLFNEVLHNASQRCNIEPLALLSQDLDDFKLVKDKLSHTTGDAVLVAVGGGSAVASAMVIPPPAWR